MGLDSLNRFIKIKKNHMLARKMNLKAYDGQFLVVNGKFEEMPRHFRGSDVTTVFKFRDFITLLYFNCSLIKTFMCILCNVFCHCKWHDTFNVYMCIISLDHLLIIYIGEIKESDHIEREGMGCMA